MTWEQTILYEQPINELIRVCLRLEHLFRQIKHYQGQVSAWDSRECLQSMLEVVSIADRPELKTNLSKELTRHHSYLNSLAQMPGIDSGQLHSILNQLNSMIQMLNHSQGKLASKLKENEFLNAIRLQLTNIGGACNINTPLLNYWLHQAASTRQELLAGWLVELEPLKAVISMLLKLIRESTMAEFKTAQGGFYEMGVDPKQSLQLLRIELPMNQNIYPEISSGRHRFCIRFLQPNFNERDVKIESDVMFKLTVCIL